MALPVELQDALASDDVEFFDKFWASEVAFVGNLADIFGQCLNRVKFRPTKMAERPTYWVRRSKATVIPGF